MFKQHVEGCTFRKLKHPHKTFCFKKGTSAGIIYLKTIPEIKFMQNNVSLLINNGILSPLTICSTESLPISKRLSIKSPSMKPFGTSLRFSVSNVLYCVCEIRIQFSVCSAKRF